jgi:hypothetical protein
MELFSTSSHIGIMNKVRLQQQGSGVLQGIKAEIAKVKPEMNGQIRSAGRVELNQINVG